jgi:hypothetical protein
MEHGKVKIRRAPHASTDHQKLPVPTLPTRTTSAETANPTVHGGADLISSVSCERTLPLIMGGWCLKLRIY